MNLLLDHGAALLVDFALGMLLGVVGGVFGIGGGLFAIPALASGFGLEQQLAQGTALVMVVPNVMLGFWRYKQRNPIAMGPAAVMGVCAMVSAWATARWAVAMDAAHLRVAFIAFLLGLVPLIVWGARRAQTRAGQGPARLQPVWMVPLGLFSGVFSGLFTVGGGLVTTPVLTGVLRVQRQTLAQGLSLAAVTPGAVAALWTYAAAGQVDWATGVPLAIGGLLSISWGVALAHRLPEAWLRAMFCAVLVLTAGWMV